MAMPEVLREFGVDPEEVLAEFGIPLAAFDDPESTLPFVTIGRLLGRCIRRTGCRHFGLMLAQKMGLSGLGAIGLLMQSAPKVSTALEALGQHLHLHDRGAAVTLEVEGDRALLGYAILVDGIENADQIFDFSMVAAGSIMRTLCGPAWSAIEVRFAHRMPRDLAPYREAFACPLRFNASRTAVVFDARWLHEPVAGADPLMHRFIQERVNELEASQERDFVGEVQRMIRASLTDPERSLQKLADQLGVSRRTLNRRLRESGTSYARLLEQVRRAAACHYLEFTLLPVGRIASMLGYSEMSVFSRAFTRWHGSGPTAWRSSRQVAAVRKADRPEN